MKINIPIRKMRIDDIRSFSKCLSDPTASFNLTFYDSEGYGDSGIHMHIKGEIKDMECNNIITITKKEALFISKSLQVLVESI